MLRFVSDQQRCDYACLLLKAIRLVKWADVVNLHLPQFDAAWIAWLGKITKTFTVLTYHCDLVMPAGFINKLSNKFVLWMNDLAAGIVIRLWRIPKIMRNTLFFFQNLLRKQKLSNLRWSCLM